MVVFVCLCWVLIPTIRCFDLMRQGGELARKGSGQGARPPWRIAVELEESVAMTLTEPDLATVA